jgi:hypothetical protein
VNGDSNKGFQGRIREKAADGAGVRRPDSLLRAPVAGHRRFYAMARRRVATMHFKPLERHELDKIATATLSRLAHA